jgi:hypothetical protein
MQPGQPLRMPAPSKQRPDQQQQKLGQRSSVIVASGLEGFLSLSALLKPEVAAVFSAMVAGGCPAGSGSDTQGVSGLRVSVRVWVGFEPATHRLNPRARQCVRVQVLYL